MAKIGVRLKINVSMIEKAALFAGKKGKYLDATAFIDLDQLDQYGNSGMITQDIKDVDKGPILGNSVVFWKSEPEQQQQPQQQQYRQQAPQQQAPQQQAPQMAQQPQQAPAGHDDFDDDIPF